MRGPNILFIMTDQMRYDCMGASGNPVIRTPNLDRLADESAFLTSTFVQAPVCVPSRQTFFTGRYPHCHRNRVNYTPLPGSETLMQRHLQEAGYTTAVVGKLHYYPPTRAFALSSGFDHALVHDGGPCDRWSDYYAWLQEHAPELTPDYRRCRTDRPNPFTAELPDKAHETSWCGRETRSALRRLARGERPFFLFSSYWKPHSPFEIPEPWAGMYDNHEIALPDACGPEYIASLPAPVRALATRGDADRFRDNPALWIWMYRAYYGAISQIDREVGRTLETLEEIGQRENTLVIFCSDHGDLMLEHGMVDKNAFFDGAIRVPLMARLPGLIPPRRHDDLIETTDVLSTIFELCGLPVPAANQGRSFATLLTAGQRGSPYEARRFVVSENIIPEVITNGRFDFEYRRGQGIKGIRHPDAKMIRTREWKLNHYVGHGEELYHLSEDPAEMRNLADDSGCRSVANQLRGELLDWLITADQDDQIAPRWMI